MTVTGLARRTSPGSSEADPDPGLTLQVEHVTKRYGVTSAVDDVSFTVQPGRVTGFLGPNGSGKSTTMKVMLDLASADHGSATIGEKRYRELTDPAGRSASTSSRTRSTPGAAAATTCAYSPTPPAFPSLALRKCWHW